MNYAELVREIREISDRLDALEMSQGDSEQWLG